MMDYVIGIMLCLISVQDIKTKQISVSSIMALGIVAWIRGIQYGDHREILFGMLPGIVLLVFYKLCCRFIGIGDIIILIVYGMAYGYIRTVVLILVSCWMAVVIGIGYMAVRRNRKVEMPMIPYIAATHIMEVLCFF